MDVYEVELEPAEPDGFAATVHAVQGLLVLDSEAPPERCAARRAPSPACTTRISRKRG